MVLPSAPSNSAAMENSQQSESKCCFQNWMAQQEQDMNQLMHAMSHDAQNTEKLTQIVRTCVKHYQEYNENRLLHARSNPSLFLTPSWCSPFENSNFWIGGCRPTLLIQLIYTLCGINIEAQLIEFLQGVRRGNLGELSLNQLVHINELQMRTVHEENMLSSKLASLQEEMGGKTLIQMVSEWDLHSASTSDANQVIGSYEQNWVSILEEADKLRFTTLKELVSTLTPLQATEFLISGKKLHLTIHEWCKRKEYQG